MSLHAYRHVLQNELRLTDIQWSYFVNNLPSPSKCNQAGYIKSCNLKADASQQNFVLTLTKIPVNRAISRRPLSDFVHFTCPDFRLHTEDGKPTTARESSDYITRLLRSGLVLNGVRYSFYGHSNSQLKSRSCFLMIGPQNEIDKVVESLGDFSSIKSVAKKAKRIGLLFSTAHIIVNVEPERCKDIADIERDGYCFTDGCGSISKSFANLVSQRNPIVFRNQRYHPSVFQIRYRGYKGVVTLEPMLPASTWLHLRKSMHKFSGGSDYGFAVVEFSKPYTYGYLNDEVILLLNALGIKLEIFERKQNEYIQFLDAAGKDPRNAFRFLASVNCMEVAEKCLLGGLETVQKQLRKLIAQERGKMINKRGEHKSRILVPRSRLLFGVCDPYGILKEGQCYVNPTSDEDGIPHALTGTHVLVTRNPCLHPGDLQKLQAVDKPKLGHLVDCIVFPTAGKRPAADMMSGGDLDGDTFFVCWDSDLIPAEIAQPAEYPGGREPIAFSKITSDDRIEYFSRSSSTQLGQVKNLFLKWARTKGPLSSECQELNRLFSQCVDANRIKIPEKLTKLTEELVPASPFILEVLHEAAETRMKAYTKSNSIDIGQTEDILLSILCDPVGLSQFELAQLTLRWCQQNQQSFESYWQFLDPTSLTTEERSWFLSLLPARSGLAESVTNDLMHSNILSHTELQRVGLRQANIRWRCVFNSSYDRLANLLEMFHKTFPFFNKKLLVLQVHERLSIAIYFPCTVHAMDDVLLKDCGRLFAFPHNKDGRTISRAVVPTKHNACLYYDQNTVQLFEGQRGNTFVFLTRSANNDSDYRNVQGQGDRARKRDETIQIGINHEWRASIALNKFNQDLVKHIGRLHREGVAGAELYIISNTDTRSLRNLDLWLEQIDTMKVHQNFANSQDGAARKLEIPVIDWDQETTAVVRMARESILGDIESANATDFARVLEIAWLSNSYDLASRVCSHWAEVIQQGHETRHPIETAVQIINFLPRFPGLVIHFVRLCPWVNLQPEVREHFISHIPNFLDALILSVNKMGHLAVSYISIILLEAPSLSVRQLKAAIEKIALTINSVDAALNVLLENFDPTTSRLLIDTPRNSQYLMKQLAGIAVSHVEEAIDGSKESGATRYQWHFQYPLEYEQQGLMLKCDYRIDAPKSVHAAIGDHVRFTSVNPPSDIILSEPVSFEALIERSDIGQLTLRCLRHPPVWYQQCSWSMHTCGSFVTAQTMIDAVSRLMTEKEACCEAFQYLFASQGRRRASIEQSKPITQLSRLNESQRKAVLQSVAGPVTCIWGPPGTGKTHTIVSVICEILAGDLKKRLLVTAPTHNAVDHVMRQYLKHVSQDTISQKVEALRVSTDVRKVASDIRVHTCDAMLGKDINQFPSARRKAQQQITHARLIFTTCIGAGLGLLRNEHFDNVIIDEASQQTEPASLVPIIKGASRIILVGDHVQLRATVQPNAQALGFDVSLFERLWTENGDHHVVQKVMLDTQYRMHPSLCAFPSREFYESKLNTAAHCKDIQLPRSEFPWPSNDARAVFIQVSTPEDLGSRSKSNTGQSQVCEEIIRLLRSPPSNPTSTITSATTTTPSPPYSIAILTPYTRQATLLQTRLPKETVSSIDGFQGQEADVIIYVTVRCNLHREIGFLKDMRRLNVAVTRAKAGLIVVGDEDTLVGKGRGSRGVLSSLDVDGRGGDGGLLDNRDPEGEVLLCYDVWKRLIAGMVKVQLGTDKKEGDAVVVEVDSGAKIDGAGVEVGKGARGRGKDTGRGPSRGRGRGRGGGRGKGSVLETR